MGNNEIELFAQIYPEISTVFQTVIDSYDEAEKYFKFWVGMYEGIIKKNAKIVEVNYFEIQRIPIETEHPIFQFLLRYVPIPFVTAPFIVRLEESLKNKNIQFKNREHKINCLLKKSTFWGTFVELLVADTLNRQGCEVFVLGDSVHSHYDLKVKYQGTKFNVEITGRKYDVNKKNSKRVIRKLLKNKASQLPKNSSNILIVLLEYKLEDEFRNHKFDLNKQINCFSVFDALYDENSPEDFVRNVGACVIKKRKPILDTFPKLKHIDSVGFWFNNQYALADMGSKTGMFLFFNKSNISLKLRDILLELNREVGKIE